MSRSLYAYTEFLHGSAEMAGDIILQVIRILVLGVFPLVVHAGNLQLGQHGCNVTNKFFNIPIAIKYVREREKRVYIEGASSRCLNAPPHCAQMQMTCSTVVLQ